VTTEAELLAAVVAEPDLDGPRLVLADWLTERGDPRGPLIQLQCELARLAPDDKRRRTLAAEEKRLRPEALAAFEVAATAARAEPGLYVQSWQMARGFVEELELVGVFARQADVLLAQTPTLRVLKHGHFGASLGDELRALAGHPRLAGLTSLTVESRPCKREDLATLARAQLPRLEALAIGGMTVQGEWLDELHQTTLTTIDELSLSPSPIGGIGLRAIARADRFRLRGLRIAGCQVDGAALADFAATAHHALRGLDAGWNPLGDEGARALTTAVFAGVEQLDLRASAVRHAEVGLLCEALPALKQLNLGNNHLGERGVRRFAEARPRFRLTALDLSANRAGDAGAAALAECEHLGGLTELSLRSNSIGDEGAECLARSPIFAALQNLNLNNNPIGLRGREALLASPSLAQARIYVGDRQLARTTKGKAKRR
jgi:uncharacterized protein (TIGR02996 family)